MRPVHTAFVVLVLLGAPSYAQLEVRAAPIPLEVTASAAPVLDFDATTVVAGGLTPGSPSILAGIGKIARGLFSATFRELLPERSDAEGMRFHEIEDGVPPHSLWFAIDGPTGSVGVGSPRLDWIGDFADPIDMTASQVGQMISNQSEFMVILVRPPNRAWAAHFVDGGRNDDDGQSGDGITASLSSLKPIANSGEPPSSIEDGDVGVFVRPRSLRYRVINFSGGGRDRK